MLPAGFKFTASTFGGWRAAACVVALLLWAAPAAAQTQSAAGDMGSGGGGMGMPGISIGGQQVDEATLEKRRKIEQAYKKATKDIPAQAAAVNDPWANMRGPDEQKPKAGQKKKPAQ